METPARPVVKTFLEDACVALCERSQQIVQKVRRGRRPWFFAISLFAGRAPRLCVRGRTTSRPRVPDAGPITASILHLGACGARQEPITCALQNQTTPVARQSQRFLFSSSSEAGSPTGGVRLPFAAIFPVRERNVDDARFKATRGRQLVNHPLVSNAKASEKSLSISIGS